MNEAEFLAFAESWAQQSMKERPGPSALGRVVERKPSEAVIIALYKEVQRLRNTQQEG